jgi:hypothetical protein
MLSAKEKMGFISLSIKSPGEVLVQELLQLTDVMGLHAKVQGKDAVRALIPGNPSTSGPSSDLRFHPPCLAHQSDRVVKTIHVLAPKIIF